MCSVLLWLKVYSTFIITRYHDTKKDLYFDHPDPKVRVCEKDYVGHTVDQFLVSTEYALKKNQKYLKLMG